MIAAWTSWAILEGDELVVSFEWGRIGLIERKMKEHGFGPRRGVSADSVSDVLSIEVDGGH